MNHREDNQRRRPATLVLVTAVIFILGCLIGFAADKYWLNVPNFSSHFYTVHVTDPKYKMISPILLSGLSVPGDTEELKEVENTLKLQTFDSLNISGMDTISVYFRDLKTNLWAGVGENLGYDPASLLKVPIMIAWYKKEEDAPGTLNQQLVWTGSPYDGKGLDFYGLQAGQSYSVNDLINMMIVKSDNDAKDLLLSNLDAATVNSVFTDLGIKAWGDAATTTSKLISPATYSRFLRVLYTSSYLDHDLSERALELLSSTDFNAGLVAGVPSDTVVAHKFGQYTTPDPTSPIELHDCGIIYAPADPYLLCVMTKGSVDITVLESVIKSISSTIYNLVGKGI